MKYATVCSGIEAPSVAWHSLGWQPVFFSEIERFPSAVLQHHYPNVPNMGDMTAIDGTKYHASIDLICGGTPCQSFSVAGLRAGLADPRGNLALVFLRLVAQIQPRWVVWENVPGVLSSNKGRDYGSFLGALGQLGYGWAYRVLDAQYFGVPQRRRRVFVVGCIGNRHAAASVLFEPESVRRDFAPRSKKGQSAAKYLTRGTGSRYDLETEDFVVDSIPIDLSNTTKPAGYNNALGIGNSGDPAYTITKANHHAVFQANASAAQSMNPGAIAPTMDKGKAGGLCVFQSHLGATQNLTISEGISDSLTKNGADSLAVFANTAPTLVKGSHNQGPGVTADTVESLVQHFNRVRRLTPMECERLQGFPDGYTLISGAKDGPRYMALGNSMAVPVMRWIGERIEAVNKILIKNEAH